MFKDPVTGNWYTQALFLELSYNNKDNVMYTLKEHDVEVEINGELRLLPSIKRLFVECGDPTEYLFATTYLGGWAHWKRICEKTKALHPYIEEWREELEVKLRSQGIQQMAEHARGEKGMQASKWLAEKGWEEKKRGAPSKAEKERELKIQSKIHQEVDDDLQRIQH